MIIYKFTNKITGKEYVGCSRLSMQDRLQAHLDKANLEKSHFQRSLRKNGVEAFDYCVIDTAETEAEMFEKETFWIKFYNCIAPNGYNLTEGGKGGATMTAEVKAKISATKTGVPNPKLKGRVISEEQRIQISRTLGGSRILAVNKKSGEELQLNSAHEGKKYGFNPSLICAVLNGHRPHHKNFVFTRISDANTEVTSENKGSETP